MQTLHRWGPLDISELNLRLEKAFSAPADSLKRNIQNDLKFLRDEDELVTYYYDKFGNFLSTDFPPDEDSFYRMKWQTRENESYKISGLKELELFKGSLIFNDPATPMLEIRQGVAKHTPGTNFFYFELNHDLYHLRIERPAQDNQKTKFFELGIGRIGTDNFADYKWSEAEGQAKALLTLQDPFLSVVDDPQKPPLSIYFYSDGTFDLLDHSNRNSPQSVEMSTEQMHKILTDLTFFKDQTKTKHWTDSQMIEEEEQGSQVGARENLKAPFLIKIQNRSGFILN